MRDPQIGRRRLLLGAAGLAAAAVPALAGCGSGTSRSSAASGGSGSKTLVVRNSGGAYGDANQKALYEPFTKETGIEVKVVNPNYAAMLAQIQQGRPQFDLIDNSMMDFLKFQRDNATQQLDHDRLKNLKNAGIAQNLVTPYAIGKNYWGSVLAYRTDAFGGAAPQSWADVWNIKTFAGPRALQGPDADRAELEFALLADGVPIDKLYPLDVDRAFKVLDQIKGSVKKWWDTGALPGVLLGRKEVVLSSVWHGRLDALIKQGNPLAYQFSGARRQSNGWAIPKGAANVDAAYQLIDYSLRPEVQAQFAAIYPMGPVVPAAISKLSDDVRKNLLSAPENLELGFDLDVAWWLENEDAVTKRWQEWSHA
jgi:putative spermidine/putrescine transport system substrate-binding protein